MQDYSLSKARNKWGEYHIQLGFMSGGSFLNLPQSGAQVNNIKSYWSVAKIATEGMKRQVNSQYRTTETNEIYRREVNQVCVEILLSFLARSYSGLCLYRLRFCKTSWFCKTAAAPVNGNARSHAMPCQNKLKLQSSYGRKTLLSPLDIQLRPQKGHSFGVRSKIIS